MKLNVELLQRRIDLSKNVKPPGIVGRQFRVGPINAAWAIDLLEGVLLTLEQAHADAGQDCRAQRRGLLDVGHFHVAPQDIGFVLHPECVLGSAAYGYEFLRRYVQCGLHALEDFEELQGDEEWKGMEEILITEYAAASKISILSKSKEFTTGSEAVSAYYLYSRMAHLI